MGESTFLSLALLTILRRGSGALLRPVVLNAMYDIIRVRVRVGVRVRVRVRVTVRVRVSVWPR